MQIRHPVPCGVSRGITCSAEELLVCESTSSGVRNAQKGAGTIPKTNKGVMKYCHRCVCFLGKLNWKKIHQPCVGKSVIPATSHGNDFLGYVYGIFSVLGISQIPGNLEAMSRVFSLIPVQIAKLVSSNVRNRTFRIHFSEVSMWVTAANQGNLWKLWEDAKCCISASQPGDALGESRRQGPQASVPLKWCSPLQVPVEDCALLL